VRTALVMHDITNVRRQYTVYRHSKRCHKIKEIEKWHTAGSLDWPFPLLKYTYIFQIKYKLTKAILSKNSTRKLLWHEITKMLIAVKNK